MAHHHTLEQLGLTRAGLTHLTTLSDASGQDLETTNDAMGIAEPSPDQVSAPTVTSMEFAI